jgi:phosphate starvation-inducible PhoH-like protein
MMIGKFFFVLPYLTTNLSYKLIDKIGSKIGHYYSFLSIRKNKSIDFDQDVMISKKSTMKKMYKSSYLPKTENQKKYVECLNDDKSKMIVVTGPAGTGKTMFACLKAIDLLNKSDIDKIIITRPIITVEEEIGFLPGNIVKKMDPWTRPIFDLFSEYYSKIELDAMINKNTIEISPLGFMRGRTFKNAFIIADEMQNSSPNQMKMLTTRLGTNSRLVITGDLEQTDYNNNNSNYNGLIELINKIKLYYNDNFSELSNKKMIQLVALEKEDIERSEIVRRMIDIYNYKPADKPQHKPADKPQHKPEDKPDDNPDDKPMGKTKETQIRLNEPIKERIINNDAALMPKHHLKSKNF